MKKKLVLLLLLVASFTACKKYLEAKPDVKLALPNSINAVQALLDNESTMNNNNPGTGEAAADNYYLADASWAALSSQAQRNMYTWENDITLNEFPNHWSRLYDVVNIANIALESLATIPAAPNEQDSWNNAKGSALFFRAKSFLTAASLWAKPYDKNTAQSDLGIPLRLNSNFEELSVRTTVQQTYNQVLNDCRQAAALLPARPQHVLRPSQTAAYGLLARTFLMMGNFDSAAVYAGKYLALSPGLVDYNTLSTTASFPIPKYNAEVIMHTLISGATILSNTNARIDSALYQSYAANDLRKTIFFKSNGNGSYTFKGSYNQANTLFNGIATDEMYLISAECQARVSNITGAMATVNQLMIKRWKTGTFVPFVATDIQSALTIILRERRKELLFRDLRWSDLKRLNKESLWQQTIQRKLNGQLVQLLPNSDRYALPIPQSVISISGMQQNPW